ncbi:response regulator transcription factor [Pseudovibrio sp. Ad37]|uniref:response regulator transcription factor n=1 Tax=Pseudovibrio sp. Ad37 TaxID=989422 RepID=UPI0007B2EB92|nr:response regulator transcription factor [Pseudovibrio sp. Ad37]KZL15192.1 Response regulator MprA [Pseudovibrio sp. Ad37]
MRILVVEDERRIAQQIEKALVAAAFSVDQCGCVEDAQMLMKSEMFDALIADRMLPDGDAIEFVSSIRKEGNDLSILMLTARDAIEDRIDGLEAGADDYLVKPFAMSELVARMRALLRRPGSVFGKTETVGSLSYNFKSRTATVNAVALPLPRHELLVLESLISNRGHVVTKDDLLNKVYGLEIPESNTIPVHVHNLRRKFKQLDAGLEIHTYRGLGYMLDSL